MDKETVIQLLQDYKLLKARSQFLEIEIQRSIENLNRIMQYPDENSIRISSSFNSDVHSYDISKPVEELAVLLADGNAPPPIRKEAEEVKRLQCEYQEHLYKIKCVDIWLEGMNERQRFIVQCTLIDGMTWAETERAYEKQFFIGLTAEGLKKIRKTALNLIYKIMQ